MTLKKCTDEVQQRLAEVLVFLDLAGVLLSLSSCLGGVQSPGATNTVLLQVDSSQTYKVPVHSNRNRERAKHHV